MFVYVLDTESTDLSFFRGAMLWTGVLLVLPFFAYAPLSAAMGDELAVGRSRTCCVLEDAPP
jgi:hypothetical protein